MAEWLFSKGNLILSKEFLALVFVKWAMFRKYVRWVSSSKPFDIFFMLMIFMNVILLCLQGSLTPEEDYKTEILMTVLTYLFLGELCIKVVGYGPIRIINFGS